MFDVIIKPFGWLMELCYSLVQNYGLALLLFTIVTKILLFPLLIKQQKNTARMRLLNPQIEKIKKKYGNNRQKIQEETMKLQAEENINPMSGCLPLLIQMPIIIGLYQVIYKPITFILGFGDKISAAKKIIQENDAFSTIANSKLFDSRPELSVLKAVDKDPQAFASLGQDFINKVQDFDLSFLGMNLGDTPEMKLNLMLLIPVFAFLTNILLTFYNQKKTKENNVMQMGMGMNAILYVMPIVSGLFTFSFPAGVGLYWIYSTVFSIFQTMLLYKIYSPEKIAVIAEKEKAKGKNKRPGLYQRMLEAQQAQQGGVNTVTSGYDADTFEEKLSKSAMKDLQRQRLNEARRRMAEKYGEEYDEGVDD